METDDLGRRPDRLIAIALLLGIVAGLLSSLLLWIGAAVFVVLGGASLAWERRRDRDHAAP